MNAHRTEQRRWSLQEQLSLAKAKDQPLSTLEKVLDKDRRAIKRRIAKNERTKLKQVMEIRKLWKSGVSLRNLNRLYGQRCDRIVNNTAFHDPRYSPHR
jgi:hypothetical protein